MGIETTAVVVNGTPTLFDHDADGVRTGTGWLRPDDGWLVLDRNGNGSIDSGRELFGVDTLITVTSTVNGQPQAITRNAANGFEALLTLDTGNGTVGSAGYGDRIFNASDAQFANVQVWRDLNQDGISQAGELQTLSAAGIASISLNSTATNTNLGNGNVVTGTAVVTRSNGSTTQVGGVQITANNLDLADNPFYRAFTDTIPLTAAARALPEMGGSGWLRDLREAMSLGTAQATQLEQAVAQFAASTTRSQQLAGVGSVLSQWAGTTGRVDTLVMGGVLRAVSRTVLSETATAQTVRYTAMDPAYVPNPATTLIAAAAFVLPNSYYAGNPLDRVLNTSGEEVIRRLGELEAYNGSRFINFTAIESVGGGGGGQGTGGGGGGGGAGGAAPTTGYQTRWVINLAADQVTNINASYDALTESVYAALVMQTRLRPYLDAVDLVIDAAGIRFDTAAMQALMATQYANTPQTGVEDLIELVRFATPTLQAVGYDGLTTLREWVEAWPVGSGLFVVAGAAGLNYTAGTAGTVKSDLIIGDWGNNTLGGGAGDDIIDGGGGAGNDTLNGGDGEDWLFGRGGVDVLNGGAGSDNLDGGAGSDTLNGGVGNNTYLFGRGEGQDSIAYNPNDVTAGKLNTLQLKAGVAPADLVLRQVYSANFATNSALEVSIAGTTDKIAIDGFFQADNPLGGYNPVQQLSFADGTVWNLAAIQAAFFAGTAAADAINGTTAADTINGGIGNDTLSGRTGDDALFGGADNDTLIGEAGNDALDGGTGNDTLNGGTGNNTFRFGRGDGQDWISYSPNDLTAGKLNTLQLKAGVAPADLVLRQIYSANFATTSALEVSIAGTTDKIVIDGFFQADNPLGGYNPVQQLSFSDGTVWNLAGIQAALFAGTAAADALNGTTAPDTIIGGAGNDTLYGRTGEDALFGGADNDTLIGEAGNDALDGGTGNDTLNGGMGNNTFRFGRGDGQDWISYSPNDLTAGKLNTLQLKAGVAPADLVLRQVYSANFATIAALEVSIAGTTDKIVIDGFFQADNPSGGYNPIQQLSFADGTVWNLAAIQVALFAGTAAADVVNGTTAADTISGGIGNDTLYGRTGDDALFGGADNDTLIGEAGNDSLDGGVGNDTLNGGLGNNTFLFGRGDGADWISYSLSDVAAGKLNTLQLKPGMAPADLVLRQVYSTSFATIAALEVSIVGTADKIVIDGFFQADNPSGGYNPVQQFRFADGTVWSLAAIQAALFAGTAAADAINGTTAADTISGGIGNDTLYGRTGDDALFGGADNDTLIGEAGNDTLDGGTGTDTLNGGLGHNTFLFGRGEGQDWISYSPNDVTAGKLNTLQFKAGVAPADLVLRQIYSANFATNSALEVAIAGTTDKIVIDGFFQADNPAGGHNPVQQFRFDNGTVWNLATIQATLFAGTAVADAINGTTAVDTISGGVGNDTLYGRTGDDALFGGADNDLLFGEAGNDTLGGGAGTDTLNGGLGNNTFLFGRGDGLDAVAYSPNDLTAGKLNTLQLKAGVVPADLVLRQVYSANFATNSALEVSIADTTDKIVIDGFFQADNPSGGYNPVQQFRFDNGTVWNLAAMHAALFAGTAAADVINGTTAADTVSGGIGSDTLCGRTGDDALFGGADNDTLMGETGNDTLDGGAGNDTLNGGLGNNTFLFGRGDGMDSVAYCPNDLTAGKLNTLQFKADVAPADLVLRQVYSTSFATNSALEVSIAGTTDKIVIDGFFQADNPGGGHNPVQQFRFDNGTVWNLATIQAMLFAGTSAVDAINGTTSVDTISGGAGNDTLYGRTGNDVLFGGADNDTLIGEAGNDTLDGGAGNDTLNGGLGSNAYRFGRGDGQDLIFYSPNDLTAGKLNTLQLKAGVAPADLVLRQVYSANFATNAALEVSIAGTTDKITLDGFFQGNNPSGGYNPVQQFQFDSGTVWNLASVVSRVSASASTSEAGEWMDGESLVYAGSHRLIEAMAGFGAHSAMHTAPLMRAQPWRPGEMLVNAV